STRRASPPSWPSRSTSLMPSSSFGDPDSDGCARDFRNDRSRGQRPGRLTPMVIAWLVLGVVLLAFELHHLAFYALFGALGAFAAAAVAVVWPDLYAAQVAAFVAVG